MGSWHICRTEKTSKASEERTASRLVGIRLETKSHDAGRLQEAQRSRSECAAGPHCTHGFLSLALVRQEALKQAHPSAVTWDFLVFKPGCERKPKTALTRPCAVLTQNSCTRAMSSRGKPTATTGERAQPAPSLQPDSLSLDPEIIPTEMLWIPWTWGN